MTPSPFGKKKTKKKNFIESDMGVKQVDCIKRTTQQVSVIMQNNRKKKNVLPGEVLFFSGKSSTCASLRLDKQSVGSTFRRISSGCHTHTPSLARTHSRHQSHMPKWVQDARRGGEGTASDQPPPLLVVFQVEGAARGAVLHRQRVGAHGQRLGLCGRAQTPR